MKITINMHRKPDHAIAWFEGVFSLHSMLEGMNKIAKQCNKSACSRLLVDVRKIQGRICRLDRFTIAEYVAERFAKGLVLALVSREDQDRPEERLFATAARNRGVQTEVFYSSDEALVWLGATPSSS